MRLFILLPILLAGCVASGPIYNEKAISKSNGTTIIVYRNGSMINSLDYFNIDINGHLSCKLYNNGFFVSSDINGDIIISASAWNLPGTSRINLKPKNNGIYYIHVEADDDKKFAGAAGGFIGQLLAEGISSNSGPYWFETREPIAAKEELKSLKQDCL